MEISQDTRDGIVVMSLSGRLDSSTAGSLEEVLPPKVAESEATVVDFSDISYVSSAGLRVMLKSAKVAKSSGHKLALSALDPSVREVFDISGFSSIFVIEDDIASACNALS